jgi:hypothetical protein
VQRGMPKSVAAEPSRSWQCSAQAWLLQLLLWLPLLCSGPPAVACKGL